MKRTLKHYDFPYAIKSFIGFLEGTGKAAHTIRNYRLDVLAFQEFLTGGKPGKTMVFNQLTRAHLEQFHEALKKQGLGVNTRRRMLMTIRRFLKYLAERKRVPSELGRRVLAPYKVERVPFTVEQVHLLDAIRGLSSATLLDARNRVLLWTLAETGCLVSEVARLRFDNWHEASAGGGSIEITGKAERTIQVSPALYAEQLMLRERASGVPWLFSGFNRFGQLGAAITPRGVEMLVKSYSPRLGFGDLTPRTFRHSAVLAWLRAGVGREEVRKRLGLRTEYAFRVFQPLLRQTSVETVKSSP